MITLCPALNILHIYKGRNRLLFYSILLLLLDSFFRFGFSLFSFVYFSFGFIFCAFGRLFYFFAGGMCIVLVDAARIKCVPYILELSLCRIIHHSRHSTEMPIFRMHKRCAQLFAGTTMVESSEYSYAAGAFFIHSHSPAVVVVVLSLALSHIWHSFLHDFYILFVDGRKQHRAVVLTII